MSYAGEILPQECWERIVSQDPAVLIDVRTRVEWHYVGVPTLDKELDENNAAIVNAAIVNQEWKVAPQMAVDPNFVEALTGQLKEGGFNEETELYFLCRTGVRSLAAAQAMTAVGFEKCFNVTNGFEGDLDENSHRGSTTGWKAAGLPWRQN